MQCEYGATSAKAQYSAGNNRQNIFIALCASTLVLAIIALAQSPFPGAFVLAEVISPPETAEHSLASHVAASPEVVAKPKAALVSQPLKKFIAAKKQSHLIEHLKSMAHTSAASHPSASATKAVRIVHPLQVQPRVEISPSHTRVEPLKAVLPHKLSSKAEAVRSHLAKGKMLDTVDDAGTTSDTSSDSASPDAAAAPAAGGAEPTEIFHSPVGDLKPTGIMSVFFNENIMITAVCVIAFLLLAICCFARNADCALS